jgi:DNA-binding response OmpR family regulator
VLTAGDLVVDKRTRRVAVRERPVVLSAKEFEPSRGSRRAAPRLHEEAPPRGLGVPGDGRTRTLESHARLRRKLCLGAEDLYVVNVWGVGYRLLD